MWRSIKQIRLEQERLRDELRVRFGWVNISDENFDAVLPPPMQRIFGANGLLRFIADDNNPKKRLWAINVGERAALAGAEKGKGGMRKVFLDYDARPWRKKPKTDRNCVRCSRDIAPETKAYVVRVLDAMVLHPEDNKEHIGEEFLIGPDCAKGIGLEFCLPEPRP